jgi:hypothetical protein
VDLKRRRANIRRKAGIGEGLALDAGTGGSVSELASTRFEVDLEPAVASRSFWRRLAFTRLNFVGNLAAEAVASEQGAAPPTVLAGSRIVIRELPSSKVVWQLATSDVTGGTSPEEMVDDIQRDLEEMSVEQFSAKWGIAV